MRQIHSIELTQIYGGDYLPELAACTFIGVTLLCTLTTSLSIKTALDESLQDTMRLVNNLVVIDFFESISFVIIALGVYRFTDHYNIQILN